MKLSSEGIKTILRITKRTTFRGIRITKYESRIRLFKHYSPNCQPQADPNSISTARRPDHFLEEAIEEKDGCYESDEAVFRLRCAGAAFCLGFAFSMLCLSACIRSIICARCGASGAVTVISWLLLFSSSMA